MLLQHLIQRAAMHSPGKAAFCCDGESVSYSELHANALQVAGFLRHQGVVPGDRIGICMPRTLEAASAVYGVFHAGAAYVPIDPASSVDVVAALLGECNIRVLLTSRSMFNQLKNLGCNSSLSCIVGWEYPPGLSSNHTSCWRWDAVLDGNWPGPVDENPDPGQLAYVIFTSGSTGKPKGIMHSHSSALAYARLVNQTYGLRDSDIIGSHAPLHTDMSTLGFYAAPYAGATTELVPEAHTRLPASLANLLAMRAITVWYSVPLALVQMLTRGGMPNSRFPSLRWILYGGEPFAPKHVKQLMQVVPSACISNVYGPAEVNQCTFFNIDEVRTATELLENDRQVPIGSVWAETHALVIDENDDVVANSGEAGELVVHSSTMMLGYFNKPELDAIAYFVHKSPNGARRYYRTGDIVREIASGCYELIGRKDRQVKVRGFRVELDHVELQLGQHPGVAEAVAFLVNGAEENDNSIHAQVSLKPGPASVDFTETDIMTFACNRLSAAAVPSSLQVVSGFPRTTSGKINRRLLSQLASS